MHRTRVCILPVLSDTERGRSHHKYINYSGLVTKTYNTACPLPKVADHRNIRAVTNWPISKELQSKWLLHNNNHYHNIATIDLLRNVATQYCYIKRCAILQSIITYVYIYTHNSLLISQLDGNKTSAEVSYSAQREIYCLRVNGCI